jgi:predicted HicB family RNase H-like nuclease
MDPKTIIIRNVPGELHAALRMLAFQRGISLNALLIEIAAKTVKEGGK